MESFLQSMEASGLSSVTYPSTHVLPSEEFGNQYLTPEVASMSTSWDIYVTWNDASHHVSYVDMAAKGECISSTRRFSKFPDNVRVSTLQNWLQVMSDGIDHSYTFLERSGDKYNVVISRT